MYVDVRLKLTSFLLIQRHAAHQHVRERKEKETESLLHNKDTKETNRSASEKERYASS